MDWEGIFNFLGKVMAVPELHALITAFAVGLAITYAATVYLPAKTPVKWAVYAARLVIFCAVMGVSFWLKPTPRMVAYAFPVAILTPLFYEWLTNLLYHWLPWLKPKALLTAPEMQVRIKEDAPLGGD